jgi:hypothetical protein
MRQTKTGASQQTMQPSRVLAFLFPVQDGSHTPTILTVAQFEATTLTVAQIEATILTAAQIEATILTVAQIEPTILTVAPIEKK